MANCKHCNAEFNDNVSRGTKKLYCTLTCSRKAAQHRAELRKKGNQLEKQEHIGEKIKLKHEYIKEISGGVLHTFLGICKDNLTEIEYDIFYKLLIKAIQYND